MNIERYKTTPYHPEADGQSEKRVQTTKAMVTAYVDQFKQDDWDLHLPYLAFAYNSGTHDTTKFSSFEAMFGRQPRLPIDLIFPIVNEPQILVEEESTQIAGSSLIEIRGLETLEEHRTTLKPEVEDNIASLKINLKRIGKALEKNRDVRMERAKELHDRRIKKEFYSKGDLVLCSHPKIAKGMKRGIAFKYTGPFRIIAVDTYGCNYTIRKEGKGHKVKRVHKNNLKLFFERSRPRPEPALVSENIAQEQNPITNLPSQDQEDSSESIKAKRSYKKNMNNPRWKKVRIESSSERANQDQDKLYDADSSGSEDLKAKRPYSKNPNSPFLIWRAEIRDFNAKTLKTNLVTTTGRSVQQSQEET